jgi:hypothetical protein
MSGVGDLADGFKAVFEFKRHTSGVKGFAPIDLQEENCFIRGRRDQYLSWDLLGINLWAREHDSASKEPHIMHTVRFPKGSPGFIGCLVYVPRLHIFVASALDMTFKIYSRELKLLESIVHEERAMLAMEYDHARDEIVMAGANGVSVWRIWRATKVSPEYVMEKLYDFENLRGMWVGGLQADVALGDVYALAGCSSYVLNLTRREVKHEMAQIHVMPVTCICWYGRSQFYLTGCMGGLIKCWTSFHYQKSKVSGGLNTQQDTKGLAALTLLHTFNLHTGAVAGIVLHPTSGMAVSASMDGMIRVLNLEMFTEIYHINLHGRGIGRMISFVLPAAPNSRGERVPGASKGRGIMFTHPDDNSIRLWRITSCAGFFGISSSDVVSLRRFLNMHVPGTFNPQYTNPNIDTRIPHIHDAKQTTNAIVKAAPQSITAGNKTQKKANVRKPSASTTVTDESGTLKKTLVTVAEAFAGNVNTFKLNIAAMDKSFEAGALAGNKINDGAAAKNAPDAKITTVLAPSIVSAPPAALRNQPFQDNIYVASLAWRDLRLFTGKGRAVTSVDPDVVVSGITCYTVSVYQHMVFALMETGALAVYCTRTVSMLVKSVAMYPLFLMKCVDIAHRAKANLLLVFSLIVSYSFRYCVRDPSPENGVIICVQCQIGLAEVQM